MNINFHGFFFLFLLSIFFISTLAFGATLSKDEVEVLQDIAKTLGKKDWDFSVDPCSGERNWASIVQVKGSENAVTCNCTFVNATVCHVTHILLKQQNLPGTLPPELVRLPYLQELGLESNQFSGNLPPELGNLNQLQRLLISSNNFTGELPDTLVKLTTLQDVRISDLSGSEHSTFPQLSDMKLKTLILRNCNINGTLPKYLEAMTSLKNLDLSFNKLSGALPSDYDPLKKVDNFYLTGNLLTGPVPSWAQKADSLDISYNNFTLSQGSQCQDANVNLFSTSSIRNDSCKTAYIYPSILGFGFPALTDCTHSHSQHISGSSSYGLHINCGGGLVTVNGSTYDDDTESAGPARFHQNGGKNWAFSTTGNFMDIDGNDLYTVSDKSTLSATNPELFKDARVSPTSLTYYGFCMGNGNYTVNLHFAEIIFIDDQTYNSLGRRIFDIYIQGELVQKDFNIAKEAGGIGMAITKPFTAVVSKNTLEIRLYWAGKGTTSIPSKGVYGPLISAITVKPEFTPPSDGGSSSISAGAVVGIVAAVAIVIILLFFILRWKGCFGKKSSLEREVKGLDLQMSLFNVRQIKSATNNFDIANKIGEGGFGPVYKGRLSDGTLVAVKQLSSKSKQGNREFLNEIGMISALNHPHLVKLYGCCVEGDQLMLIYEYLENNSLARALFGPPEHQIKLDWPTRYRICVGIARGLAYLHEESRLKVVHRDIKATNVLLDKDLNPKISDFGLAKLDEEENTHISTRIAGTYGYMAPEYAMHGYLTDKADVYSFGIVALEILHGSNNTILRQKGSEAFHLLDWAHVLKEENNLLELVDKRLGSNFNKEEAMIMINVGLLCTNVTSALRPAMSSVVSMLEGKIAIKELILESSEVLDEKKMEAMRQYYQDHSISMEEGPWTGTSSSVATDLYPVDSSYLEKRV
ncbi:hypothetical protein TSUD_248730 [Trifolium subterraneum]|uniref:non-specific serine/threonine protein kinase n=1 Tax=Trifolium subterraneum TaxID=3900 RepID=A0A2Z6LK88_TRISU|nr:hypothetical protein TSUD_248730 [Trifolium subterraneum]